MLKCFLMIIVPNGVLNWDIVDELFAVLDLACFRLLLVQALVVARAPAQSRRRNSSWLMIVVIWFVAMTWVNKFPILFECIALHPLSNFETHDEQPSLTSSSSSLLS